MKVQKDVSVVLDAPGIGVKVERFYLFCFFSVSLCSILYYFFGALFQVFIVASILLSFFVFLSVGRLDKRFIAEFLISILCVLFSFFSIRFGTLGGVYISLNIFLMLCLAVGVGRVVAGSYRYLDRIRDGSLAILLFCYFYFLFKIVWSKYTGVTDPQYLELGSRNIASAILIFAQVFFTAINYLAREKVPILTPIVTFGFCVVFHGRTGVALSFLWLFFSFYERWRGSKIFTMVSLVSFGALIFFYFEGLASVVSDSTKFNHGLETIRFEMWREYISSLSIETFLLGQEFDVSPLIVFDGGGSPHNSYISGHHFMGAAYLLLVLFMLLRSVLFFKRDRLIVLAGFWLLMFRALWDVISLPGYFSVFVLVLYVLLFVDIDSGCKGERSLAMRG